MREFIKSLTDEERAQFTGKEFIELERELKEAVERKFEAKRSELMVRAMNVRAQNDET